MAGLFISDVFTSHAGLIMPSSHINYGGAGRSISGPSSASSKSNSHINYGGSRREARRFRYKSRKSRAGFVELAPIWVPTAGQLYEWNEDCQGLVERVEWQSSNASQGQVGGTCPSATSRCSRGGIPQALPRTSTWSSGSGSWRPGVSGTTGAHTCLV